MNPAAPASAVTRTARTTSRAGPPSACTSSSPTLFDQTALPVAASILFIIPPQSGT